MSRRWRHLLGAAALGAAAYLCFLPALDNGFVDFDDGDYVTLNPQVNSGLTLEGLAWAFTRKHSGNWHPLTWLSHMLDCQLWGLEPRGHHRTGLLLHAANAALVYLVLARLTRSEGRSAMAAALFALHPQRVESVAWVSERKDVLFLLFGLWALLAYARYAERPSRGRMAAVTALLALGLMSKPMLVSFPLLLLLVDLWPLGRWGPGRVAALGPLALEKLPLFALAAASAVVTYLVQRDSGAVSDLEKITPLWRAGNALVSYLRYVWMMLWPVDLAVFYPHPGAELSPWLAAGAGAALLGLTALAAISARRRPWLAAGWGWYLTSLVPVIGFVQVGGQAMADRYTYLPCIGLAVAAVWGAAEVAGAGRLRRRAAAALGVAVLAALALLTWRQTARWRDTETLFAHTLAVTGENWRAHNKLADVYAGRGDLERAVHHYERSFDLYERAVKARVPAHAGARNNLGVLYTRLGRMEDAARQFRESLAVDPLDEVARGNLVRAVVSVANERAQEGRFDEAYALYEEALGLDPQGAETRSNYGTALVLAGRPEDAIGQFREALRLDPGYADAENNWGVALQRLGRHDEARDHFRAALRLDPDHERARKNLEGGGG